MAAVTVLGLGPMGQAVARAMLAGAHDVTVWNRTAERAGPVVEAGATAAATLDDAIAGAELLLVCLRDDEAVATVLADADLAGRALVNTTSNSPAGSRQLAERVVDRGGSYLTGAIMTPTPLMGTDQALVLFSGDAQLYEGNQSTLAAFHGKQVFVGDDPGRASAFDAALLDLFWTATAGMVHALALANSEQIAWADLEPFAPAIFAMLPGMMSRFGDQLGTGVFPGDVSTIASAEAGLRHLVEASESSGIDAGVLRASLATVQHAIEQGHQDDGLGRLAAVLGA